MKANTRKRKESREVFERLYGRQELVDQMYRILSEGKRGIDAFLLELGRSMAEAVMYLEREEIAGPDYHPKDSRIQKWDSQGGSIYRADQKVAVDHPRLRGPQGEIVLESYERLRKPEGFSGDLQCKVLRGDIVSEVCRDGNGDGWGVWGVGGQSFAAHYRGHGKETRGVQGKGFERIQTVCGICGHDFPCQSSVQSGCGDRPCRGEAGAGLLGGGHREQRCVSGAVF